MTTSKSLAIVLPCYNPPEGWAGNITSNIRQLEAALPGITLHLYIVNDGSTKRLVQEDLETLQQLPHFQYLTYTENQGKGYALRMGIKEVEQELCIYTDIDFPYTQESFLKVYEKLHSGSCDIAVGIRDAQYYASVPPARIRISKSLRFITQKLMRLPVSDTQCGIKGFNRKGREVFLRTDIDRYLFDLEFIYLASKEKGLRLQPVPVTLRPGIVFRHMNMSILAHEGYSFFKLMLTRPFSRSKGK